MGASFQILGYESGFVCLKQILSGLGPVIETVRAAQGNASISERRVFSMRHNLFGLLRCINLWNQKACSTAIQRLENCLTPDFRYADNG